MAFPTPHITVCICTFKRPGLLLQLLEKLVEQRRDGRFTHSVVIVDNDASASARAVVEAFQSSVSLPIYYTVEPRRNIALARNKAVATASGDFIAFIDDDEEPRADWLLLMLSTLLRYGADGVLGPVIPRFVTLPPKWVLRGKFFTRPSPPTGTWLTWKNTRAGNVMVRRSLFDSRSDWFSEQYGRGGETVTSFVVS